MKTIHTLILLLFTNLMVAQTDSIQLTQDALGLKDIQISKEDAKKDRVMTVRKTMNDVDELPQTVYIVTGEEILRNGYFTLTDVLKSVPGIFVSKVGSALEGETFLMNGLRGNRHTKILINNIPIKPANLVGMPIGSQLPIRQAERIEVTYGPTFALNGTDAGAGMINIVTRQSDRPVYTHADLGIGTEAYNSVNVLFGGKLGKNKRILKFNAYGSSTEMRNITLNPDGTPSVDVNNYSVILGGEESYSYQDRVDFPHQSKQIGVQLDYRSLSFSLMRMSRTDHSAMGSNPLAHSYLNPQTTFGEQISHGTFIFKPSWKRFGLRTTISFTDYEINKNSSFEFNQPFVKQLMNYAAVQAANGDSLLEESYLAWNDSSYFSGRRFVKGKIANGKMEQLISIYPFKNLELIIGANLNISNLNNESPYENYLPDPSRESIEVFQEFFDINFFTQSYLTFKKLNLILGANLYRYQPSSNFYPIQKKFLPSVAFLYKLRSNLRIRGSFSQSFKVPSDYFELQSGVISYGRSGNPLLDQPTLTQGLVNLGNQTETEKFLPQETTYADLGLTWNWKDRIRYEGSVFYSENKNLMNFGYQDIRFTAPDSNPFILYGYFNDGDLHSNLIGIRNSIRVQNVVDVMKLNINFHYTYFMGNQKLVNGEEMNRVLSQPDYIANFILSFRLFSKLYMTFDGNWAGQRASSQVKTVENYYENSIDFFRTKQFNRASQFTLDVMLSLPINDNFRLFCKYNNLLYESSGGLDASGTPDDLYWNLQRGRYLRGGASYTID